MKNKDKKKPHFVSEERTLRQYERCEFSLSHLLYTLCNEIANVIQYKAIFTTTDIYQHKI